MKRLMAAAVLLLFLCVSAAQGRGPHGCDYELRGEGAVILSCEETEQDFSLPVKLDGFPVIGIGDGAFADNTRIEVLRMPASIEFIGERAFAGCTKLREIAVSAGLKKIGREAFLDCTGLVNIVLPSKLEEIGSRAFAGCENILYIRDITGGNLETVGSGVFDDTAWFTNFRGDFVTICQGCLLLKYRGNEENPSLPWDIVYIAEDAFSGNDRTVKLKLPNYLTELREGSISNMSSLTTVYGGSGLKTVKDRAFRGLPALSSVMLDTVALGAENFEDCPLSPFGSETTEPYDPSVPDEADAFFETEYDDAMGGVVIAHCIPGTVFPEGEAVIPDRIRGRRVVAIGVGACQDRADIRRLVLPKFLLEIRSWAFSWNSALAEVEFPDRLQRIEADAFSGCPIADDPPELPGVETDPRAFYQTNSN